MAVDHREYMVQLINENNWQRGVELGLGNGMMFRKVLQETNIQQYVGVDLGLRKDRRAKLEKIGFDFYKRCAIFYTSTAKAADSINNNWADFIFIDASHSYEAVKDDIKRWQPKLKKSGWFGGHDYHPKWSGVIRAVDEAFGSNVIVLDHYIWSVGKENPNA